MANNKRCFLFFSFLLERNDTGVVPRVIPIFQLRAHKPRTAGIVVHDLSLTIRIDRDTILPHGDARFHMRDAYTP